MTPAYKRVLLKLSGEFLVGSQSFGIDPERCLFIASQIQKISRLGVEVAIVIGGGNIFRGAQAKTLGMERTPADHVGMLATLLNAIVLQQALEKVECDSRIMSAIACHEMAEVYSWKNAHAYLGQGIVLIFAGGTGNPYFTTDSAAVLRALEVRAELVLKVTKVDGIYDRDPKLDEKAIKFDQISYNDVLSYQLKVMDATAVALARDNRLPIRVITEVDLMKAVCAEPVGTLVR
jgi:uridylate kinase